VSVGIEQFAEGETVRGLGGTDLGVNGHERLSRELRGRLGGLVRNMGNQFRGVPRRFSR
jgi:hypothetical protein